jgi:STE24 endopeptidase
MNIYGIIILATLLIDFSLQLLADLLNLRALQDTIPAEFQGTFDPKRYQKSQQYLGVTTRFGLFTSTISLAATLVFWFAGGFNYLDILVREWEFPELPTGLLYIGLLLLLKMILSLPFTIYDTFIIESRFGFNKTTVATFIADRLKGVILGVLIGSPLLAGILFFLGTAGQLAWLYCWFISTTVTLVIQFIAPTWIMPLFNKFTPLAKGPLKEAILNYARSVKFPLENVFVIDGSRRSNKANAFFTGFGKHRRIALFDTLIEQQSTSELVAILAHEIGHYCKKHILKNLLVAIIQMGFMFYLLNLFIGKPALFTAFYLDQPSIYAGLILFGLLYSPVEFLLAIILQYISRKYEYEADAFASQTTGNPESLVSALKKLAANNLSNLTPHPLYVLLHYSHPPLGQRIAALRNNRQQEKQESGRR